jgi:hypothetical protein
VIARCVTLLTRDVPVPRVAVAAPKVGVIGVVRGRGATVARDEGEAHGEAHNIGVGCLAVPDCHVRGEDGVIARIHDGRHPVGAFVDDVVPTGYVSTADAGPAVKVVGRDPVSDSVGADGVVVDPSVAPEDMLVSGTLFSREDNRVI